MTPEIPGAVSRETKNDPTSAPSGTVEPCRLSIRLRNPERQLQRVQSRDLIVEVNGQELPYFDLTLNLPQSGVVRAVLSFYPQHIDVDTGVLALLQPSPISPQE